MGILANKVPRVAAWVGSARWWRSQGLVTCCSSQSLAPGDSGGLLSAQRQLASPPPHALLTAGPQCHLKQEVQVWCSQVQDFSSLTFPFGSKRQQPPVGVLTNASQWGIFSGLEADSSPGCRDVLRLHWIWVHPQRATWPWKLKAELRI